MKACFIGLGYIGLPTAIIAANKGIDIVGVDINHTIVRQTNDGKSHIVEAGLQELLQNAVNSRKLTARESPVKADAFFLFVPTPINTQKMPDISFVEAATQSVIPLLEPGNLFVIESTVPVGTTEKMAELIFRERPELRDKLFIAYCPERMIPGNAVYELTHNDRIIGGIDEASAEKAARFYSEFVEGKLHTTNTRTAEICKLVENSFRDVQIAFANELSIICQRAGIDVSTLIELANLHPRVNILTPGCGVGGHCIAVDPYFLISKFPEETTLIQHARKVNTYKTQWCITEIKKSINDFELKFKRRPKVAMMGLAFKPDIDDLRESPAIDIVSEIMKLSNNTEILISEPNLSRHQFFNLTDYNESFRAADIVVFLVAHTPFKNLPQNTDKVILDFCGVYK
ncbi:MAG: UDP-N-acetyl-D-mannosamine dehydrogenase [Bacteroidales bacterium]|nr:UDP-N-acetyl-D-mannosamine dehydrogenase [Bacteroidales bacterium]